MRGTKMNAVSLGRDPVHPAGFGAITHCPECRSERLDAVSDDDVTNFLCEGCGRCWHVEMGYVHRVDPTTCTTCPHRAECLRRWRADVGRRKRAG